MEAMSRYSLIYVGEGLVADAAPGLDVLVLGVFTFVIDGATVLGC